MQELINDYRKVTVRLLAPGHLEKNYPITSFFENKRFSSFFAKGPVKFKVQLCHL